MAVTQNSYTGNGSTTQYSFTFPYLKSSEVKAQIDATVTTAFTLANATTVQFNTAPANGAKIKIYRETDDAALAATFYAGSAIKSEDLNDNFTQNLYTTQEVNARYLSNLGGTMVGDLTMGEDADMVFEGATDDAYETTLTVADPTADRTITLPNVTGTVVTTGDTATVTATMLADDSVNTAELVNSAVTTGKINTSAVTTAKIADDAVTGIKIADDQINSEHYVDGSIDTAHIADSQITTAKIAADAITQAKIADDAVGADQLASNSVVSASIVDGTIVTADIADNAITNAKMADDAIGAAELIDTSVGTAALASNAVTLAKMADSSVGTAEIVNDAVTTVKIANNAVTTAKITDSNVTTAKINNDAVTQDKIADDAVGTAQLIDASVNADRIASNAVTTAKIQDDAVTSAKIAANAVTTTEIADAELTTLAGMQTGTASILAAGTTLTATLAEINTVVDGKSVETTISDTDAAYPTSGAVVDYVAAQIAPIGGLEVIATEVAFPNTQPSAGVVISIADAGGIVVNGSGTSTTGRTVGGTTVTINNIASNFNSSTIDAGVSFMVSSTGSGQIYNYHKATLKEADILNLSNDINDFGNRYRVASSAPSSSLDDGDLWYDTANAKMMVYSATNSQWEEVSSTGDFYINTISSYSGTGGNSASFNGSAYRFTLSNPPSSAQQLVVSVNGVVQKPNSGTGQPSEGFAINGSTIVFSAAPATGADYFIITVGSTVAIGTPSDNTVATAKIQNLAVTGDKVATNLDLADNKKIRFGTGNDLSIYHDGANSHLNNSTGYLVVGTDSYALKDQSLNEFYIKALKDGAVELYYDNSLKFHTRSDGVRVIGDATWSDNGKARFGPDGDLEIYYDGTDSIIKAAGTATPIKIQGHSSNSSTVHISARADKETIKCLNNSNAPYVELYYDNAKKLETSSIGVNLTGNLTLDAEINLLGGSDAARFIDSQVGDGNALHLRRITGGDAGHEDMAKFTGGGAVELYYDNSKKFETTSAGVSTTGTSLHTDNIKITVDNGAFYCGAGDDLGILHDGTDTTITNNTGNLLIYSANDFYIKHGTEVMFAAKDDGAVDLYCDNELKLTTTTSGVKIKDTSATTTWVGLETSDGICGWLVGQSNAGSGSEKAVAIYNAAGDETHLRGINNKGVELYYDNSQKLSTGSGGIVVSGSYYTNDGNYIYLGSDNDLRIYHDGSNSYIDQSGAGDLYIRTLGSQEVIRLNASKDIELRVASGNDVAAKFIGDGAVELYYDNALAFATGSNGNYHSKHCDPSANDTYNLGHLHRWKTLYTNNAVNVSSDRNTKNTIIDSDLGLSFINQLRPVSFKKNNQGDSIHYGLIAQEVEDVIINTGKSLEEFSAISKPTDKTMGLAYSEFISPLIKAVQELTTEVQTLKTKVAALEAK